MALVTRKPQAHERLGERALLAPLPHEQQQPRAARHVVDVPLPRGRGGGGGALALPVEQRRPEGQVALAGGRGEEGFALFEGDEQQVALAGFVPEHAFAVKGVHAQGTAEALLFGHQSSSRNSSGVRPASRAMAPMVMALLMMRWPDSITTR
jgi:hypothetical protein